MLLYPNLKADEAIENLNAIMKYIENNPEDIMEEDYTKNFIIPMKQLCPFKKRVTFSYNTNYGDKRFLTNQTECFEYCDKEYCMGWDEINERCRLIIKNDT